MSIITIFHNHELKRQYILKVFYVFEFGNYKTCNDFELIIMRNRKT